MDSAEIADITNYINLIRKRHGSPPLVFDESISEAAQKWSDYLLLNNKFEHSSNRLYGENLYFSYGSPSTRLNQIKSSIDNWYSEISKYDFSKTSHQIGTGHFSALIWKSSTKYGIGYSSTKSKCVICLNTTPVGNIGGMYKANVNKLI